MMARRQLAVALLHFPVLDREGNSVTAAITNIDLHDISRSAYTYEVAAFYVVHPVAAQRQLAERVREHWVNGSGGRRIPDRKLPLAKLRVVPSLDDALDDYSSEPAEVWTTSAKAGESTLPLDEARRMLREPGPPIVLCLGTSWGLAPEVHARATRSLAPITSPRRDGYNHLSVRAAAAILFDRLLATEWPPA